jgi:soluble lytic murein transglycosylase-like protein
MRTLVQAFAQIIVLGVVLNASSARADIYVFVDKNGVKNFSNIKLDSGYQAFIFGENSPAGSQFGSRNQASATPLKAAVLRTLSQHPNLKKFEPLLAQAANDFSVDLALLKAVMAVESRFNPVAVSHKGAVGLMQVMPATAARYGLFADKIQTIQQKLADPETNIRLAARYLRDLQNMFPRQPELMLASYNAGEGAVQKYKNQIPPYPETRNYVQLVTQFYQLYKPAI